MLPAGSSPAAARPGLADTARLTQLKTAPRRSGEASFFYYDAHFRNEAVKVLPGEYFVHHEDILITTTLGSCIAACLWDRERGIGGMNHFMLPERGGATDSGRYGSFAMELLINELIKRGATRSSMEAKVFGGAAVVSGMNSLNVGERNTSFVLDYLRTERITVVSRDVLDIHPRKVCFLPSSGKALVKRLAAVHTASLLARETEAARAQAPAAAGTIDLF